MDTSLLASAEIDIRSLPPQMRRLIDLIGFDATMKLLQARGGCKVHIPKTPTKGRVLAKIIGLQALTALCDHFGDEQLELPKDDKPIIQARNAAVVKRRADGASHSELAVEFNITRRWSIEICKAYEQEVQVKSRQGKLF